MLGPAPSCMKAAMDEDQRGVLWTRLLLLIRVGAEGTLLEDDFHTQTRGELVEKTGLPLFQVVGDSHSTGPVEDCEGLFGLCGEAAGWRKRRNGRD